MYLSIVEIFFQPLVEVVGIGPMSDEISPFIPMGVYVAYKRYSDQVKYLISKTRNPDLFPNLEIPRNTAKYWIKEEFHKKLPFKPKDARKSELDLLRQKVSKLKEENRNLKSQITCLQGYVGILKKKGLIKRITDSKTKKTLVILIQTNKGRNSVRKVLNSLDISFSQYQRWRSSVYKSHKNMDQARPTSLTFMEVQKIKDIYSSKDFFFFPIHALSTKAKRDGLIYACPKTWSHYIKTFNLKRAHLKPFKQKEYKIGIQADFPGQLWHMDVTEVRIRGKKLYLQLILDNYSRMVIAFQFINKIGGIKSKDLLLRSLHNYETPQKLMTDAGKENLNHNVSELLTNNQIKHYVAKKNTLFSNSRVETFFRMLKSNYLSYLSINNPYTLKQEITFYIKQYNYEIPHSALSFRTPHESYTGMDERYYVEKFKEMRKEVFLRRRLAFKDQ